MNEGIHLDLDTWIVPGQIRKANLCRGVGNRYTPAGTEVLISAVAVVIGRGGLDKSVTLRRGAEKGH